MCWARINPEPRCCTQLASYQHQHPNAHSGRSCIPAMWQSLPYPAKQDEHDARKRESQFLGLWLSVQGPRWRSSSGRRRINTILGPWRVGVRLPPQAQAQAQKLAREASRSRDPAGNQRPSTRRPSFGSEWHLSAGSISCFLKPCMVEPQERMLRSVLTARYKKYAHTSHAQLSQVRCRQPMCLAGLARPTLSPFPPSTPAGPNPFSGSGEACFDAF